MMSNTPNTLTIYSSDETHSYSVNKDVLSDKTTIPFDEEDDNIILPYSASYCENLSVCLNSDWERFNTLTPANKLEVLMIERDHFHFKEKDITNRVCFEEHDILEIFKTLPDICDGVYDEDIELTEDEVSGIIEKVNTKDKRTYMELNLELHQIAKIMKMRYNQRKVYDILSHGYLGANIIEIMKTKFDYEIKIENPEELFWEGLMKNNSVVVTFVAKNFDIDIDSENTRYTMVRRTPLHYTVNTNSVEMTRTLLSLGADADRTALYTSPLTEAARWGRTEIAKLLIDAGADVN